jgi:hypothetical protein
MTDELKVKSKDECRWDQVSLGEVMLRLDPGQAEFTPPEHLKCGKAAANTTSRED